MIDRDNVLLFFFVVMLFFVCYSLLVLKNVLSKYMVLIWVWLQLYEECCDYAWITIEIERVSRCEN